MVLWKSFSSIFFISSLFLISDYADARFSPAFSPFGSSCRTQAQRALARGNNHIVFTMEGLTGELAELLPIGHARNGVARKIRSVSGANYDIRGYSHALGPSRIARCARDWKSVHGDNLRVTIIGHSLGGGPALLAAAQRLRRERIDIDTLVSLDGRHSSDAAACRFRGRTPTYRQPAGVTRVLSFRQCGGGLPGRNWTGPNVKNFVVGNSHVTVPYDSVVQREVGRLLGTSAPGRQGSTFQTAGLDRTPASTSQPRVIRASHPVTGTRYTATQMRRAGLSEDAVRKADRSAWCFRGAVRYACSYAEASMNSYQER